jgi:hypothetical protein
LKEPEPHVRQIYNYACHCLGLKSYFQRPGDGRIHPHIPARDLVWAILIGHILRVSSYARLEWLAHSPVRAELGLQGKFGDDALAYCTERMDPETTRAALASTLCQAKRNKAFENSRFIGLAIDGTGAGHTCKSPCSFCHPVKDGKGVIHGHVHQFVMISIVGTGLPLPFDVEPYGPGDSEYAAGQRLLKRAVSLLGPRFADYVVADAKFATAPFLHTTDEVHLPIVTRLKDNLPELYAAAQARFTSQPPHTVFEWDGDRIEVWDADDFTAWETLQWPSVRVLRYRQHKPNGTVIEAYWHTNFSIRQVASLSLFRLAKSRWEIENQGFNEAKNLHGMEHIAHHEPNSLLLDWLLLLLAMMIERLYRVRYLHRGEHPVRSAIDLVYSLWINLSRTPPLDSG